MKALFRAGVVCSFCAGVAGCANTGASMDTTAPATAVGAKTILAHDPKDAITVGKSTKADVMAALGNTTIIRFDSGFEVWLYQVAGDTPAKPGGGGFFGSAGSKRDARGKTEFVILFAPSGFVTKTRLRPAPSPSEAN